MNIRRWMARKLFPAIFRDAERYYFLAHRIDELKWWCGHDFPLIDEATSWLRKSDSVHWMPLTEYKAAISRGNHQSVCVSNISDFRERLRRKHATTGATVRESGQS